MAYTKQTWNNGDIITAEKLNHIEDGIAEWGCDCGFSCDETETVLTEESVTTIIPEGEAVASAPLTYGEDLPQTITVIFSGVSYACEKNDDYGYGAPYDDNTGFDWSEYPFNISTGGGNYILTENAGTYTVKIMTEDENISVTECFTKAVEKAIIEGGFVVNIVESGSTMGPLTFTADKTMKQIYDNFVSGKIFNVMLVGQAMRAQSYRIISANTNSITLDREIAPYMHDTSDSLIAADQNAYPSVTLNLQG